MSEAPQGANRKLLLAYAESSRDLAAPLQKAFEAAGFDVASCTDARPTGPEATDGAVAVVVCWTPAAVASDVVNLQAARAQKARKLAPVLLAPCTPPENLGRPLADLSGWRGDATDLEFLRLVHALHARLTKRMFSSDFWRSRYLSWGGLGAASLGAIAIIANLGDLTQTIDGLANPAATQRDLSATNAKLDELVNIVRQKSDQPLSPDAEAALRESIERLLSAQTGARGRAAARLETGDFNGALIELNAAAAEGEKAVAGLAEIWQEIGALAYAEDTYAAIEAYERADQLAPDNFTTLSQLGNLYIRTGRLNEAQDALEEAHVLAGDEPAAALALGHLGTLASMRGNLSEAESYFRKALAINERNADPVYKAADLADLGGIMREKRRFTEADAYLRQAIDIYRHAGDTLGEANVLLRVGELASDRKRVQEAENAYVRAAAIYETASDKEGLSAALNSLAAIALANDDIDKAREHLDRALKAARDMNFLEGEAFALGLWGNIAEAEGKKTDAIRFYRESISIYDEITMPALAEPHRARLKALGATPHPWGPEN